MWVIARGDATSRRMCPPERSTLVGRAELGGAAATAEPAAVLAAWEDCGIPAGIAGGVSTVVVRADVTAVVTWRSRPARGCGDESAITAERLQHNTREVVLMLHALQYCADDARVIAARMQQFAHSLTSLIGVRRTMYPALMIRLLLVGTLSAMIACTDLTPPADAIPEVPGPVVSVAQRSHNWASDSEVLVIAHNPQDAPVYYTCGPLELQRYRNGWQHSPLPMGWIDCGTLRLTATDSFPLQLSLTNDFFPTSGWYRLVYRFYRDSALTSSWPEANRASPAFEVRP